MADEIWTILKVLQWTQRRFGERGLRTPRLDAEVLLAHLLARDRVALYTHFDQPLAKEELAAYRELIRQRLTGEPVAYLVGKQEFWSLAFAVDRRVLIPRPETEGLVEAVLKLVAGRPSPSVADIGTGSGAIAVAVAHERPDARVVAVERSPDALAVARANVAAHGVAVELREGDLLLPITRDAPWDVIASNPPYIAEPEFPSLPAEVRCEPREALLAGEDGLAVIRRLIEGALPLLAGEGALMLEVGAGQAPEVAELARARGYRTIETTRDLAGIERVVIARR
ncbi:MAG: peptide chain release factor N(5)-glutamine methyltransferase [Myxococcales bacterium]|nr:peptide chain release factor N(5)-glutamine methyltransferase [Myxococcales bacterium]